MRTREIAALTAVALAGCITNPDPRSPKIRDVVQNGYGGYIIVTTGDHHELAGELISIDGDVIRVLRLSGPPPFFQYVRMNEVLSAELFEYEAESGFGAWGLVGTLSTISHGFLLALSAPVWLISTGIATGAESRSVHLEYPGDGWNEFWPWARFPQGLPPGTTEDDLVLSRAHRAPHAPTVAPPPTIDQVREEARGQAWSLTKKAAAAGRANDCATVLTLSGQVQTIDADFYDTVFLGDPSIRACLGLAPAASPPVPPPATP